MLSNCRMVLCLIIVMEIGGSQIEQRHLHYASHHRKRHRLHSRQSRITSERIDNGAARNTSLKLEESQFQSNGCKEELQDYNACICSDENVTCENVQLKDPAVFTKITPRYYPRLKRLTFIGNNFVFLPRSLFGHNVVHEHLQYLDLSANYIMRIDPLAFASIPALQTLNLSFNEIALNSNMTDFLRPLQNLRTLVLRASFNGPPNRTEQLDLLSKSIKTADLTQLSHLNMEENIFPIVPFNLLCHLPNLKQLLFGVNAVRNVSNLSSSVKRGCLNSIHLIDLRQNKIEAFDKDFTSAVDSIKQELDLRLSYNRFRCDCLLNSFVLWLKTSLSKAKLTVDADRIICGSESPSKYAGLRLIELPSGQLACGQTNGCVSFGKPYYWINLELATVCTLGLQFIAMHDFMAV